jgi:hypothetical protein
MLSMFTLPIAIETSKSTIPTPAKSTPQQFIVPCVWREDNSILSLLDIFFKNSSPKLHAPEKKNPCLVRPMNASDLDFTRNKGFEIRNPDSGTQGPFAHPLCGGRVESSALSSCLKLAEEFVVLHYAESNI